MITKLLAAAAALAIAVPAAAQTVDGIRDDSYGGPAASVIYSPIAPTSNFGTPTNLSDASAYDIYLTSDANNVYGFIQSDRTTPVIGANLYFDINPSVGNGSDLGFEITNGRAFIPGVNGYSAGSKTSPLAGLAYAISADQTGIEFSIANSLFTAPIAGLDYQGLGGPFPTTGSTIRLNLSQSFGYSVAGGQGFYGDNRLGVAVLGGASGTGAVPEPATWAMLVLGFGMAGHALRRRRAAGRRPIAA